MPDYSPYNDLETVLENESRTLNLEDDLSAAEKYKITNQRFWMRWALFGILVALLVFLGAITIWAFCLSGHPVPRSNMFYVLAIAPLVSLTVLGTIALLTIFYGFRNAEMKLSDLPVGLLARMLSRSSGDAS
ncbi:MAG: hypothetical protein OXC91_07165 [Rhodobacteraceae bacterium]|nr:hypothetical protein [Paracoccaceae bacterium]